MKFRFLFCLAFLFIFLMAGIRVQAGGPAAVQIDPNACSPLPPPQGRSTGKRFVSGSDEAYRRSWCLYLFVYRLLG